MTRDALTTKVHLRNWEQYLIRLVFGSLVLLVIIFLVLVLVIVFLGLISLALAALEFDLMPPPIEDPIQLRACVSDIGRYGDKTEMVMRNIERVQQESDWFRKQGMNNYGMLLNVSLLVGGVVGTLIAVAEGTDLIRRITKPRKVLLLTLSVVVPVASIAGAYLKNKSEQFYIENRNRYSELSLKIDEAIWGFCLDNGSETLDLRNTLIRSAKNTLDHIDALKLEYAEKYDLNTKPDLDPQASPQPASLNSRTALWLSLFRAFPALQGN